MDLPLLHAFAQIHLDGENLGSNAEGAMPDELLAHLSSVYAHYSNINPLFTKLREQADLLLSLNTSDDICTHLQQHDQAIFKAGWRMDDSRHAIYISVQKKPHSDLYSVTIYNRGLGVNEKHAVVFDTIGKQKIVPYATYNYVRIKNELILKEFISKLIAPTQDSFKSSVDKKKFYTYYETIITLYSPPPHKITLQPPSAKDLKRVTSTQRSGSCTWKSYTAALYYLCETKDTPSLSHQNHTDLITDIKLGSLLEFSSIEEHPDSLSRTLLDRAFISLNKRVQKKITQDPNHLKINFWSDKLTEIKENLTNSSPPSAPPEDTLPQVETTKWEEPTIHEIATSTQDLEDCDRGQRGIVSWNSLCWKSNMYIYLAVARFRNMNRRPTDHDVPQQLEDAIYISKYMLNNIYCEKSIDHEKILTVAVIKNEPPNFSNGTFDKHMLYRFSVMLYFFYVSCEETTISDKKFQMRHIFFRSAFRYWNSSFPNKPKPEQTSWFHPLTQQLQALMNDLLEPPKENPSHNFDNDLFFPEAGITFPTVSSSPYRQVRIYDDIHAAENSESSIHHVDWASQLLIDHLVAISQLFATESGERPTFQWMNDSIATMYLPTDRIRARQSKKIHNLLDSYKKTVTIWEEPYTPDSNPHAALATISSTYLSEPSRKAIQELLFTLAPSFDGSPPISRLCSFLRHNVILEDIHSWPTGTAKKTTKPSLILLQRYFWIKILNQGFLRGLKEEETADLSRAILDKYTQLHHEKKQPATHHLVLGMSLLLNHTEHPHAVLPAARKMAQEIDPTQHEYELLILLSHLSVIITSTTHTCPDHSSSLPSDLIPFDELKHPDFFYFASFQILIEFLPTEFTLEYATDLEALRQWSSKKMSEILGHIHPTQPTELPDSFLKSLVKEKFPSLSSSTLCYQFTADSFDLTTTEKPHETIFINYMGGVKSTLTLPTPFPLDKLYSSQFSQIFKFPHLIANITPTEGGHTFEYFSQKLLLHRSSDLFLDHNGVYFSYNNYRTAHEFFSGYKSVWSHRTGGTILLDHPINSAKRFEILTFDQGAWVNQQYRTFMITPNKNSPLARIASAHGVYMQSRDPNINDQIALHHLNLYFTKKPHPLNQWSCTLYPHHVVTTHDPCISRFMDNLLYFKHYLLLTSPHHPPLILIPTFKTRLSTSGRYYETQKWRYRTTYLDPDWLADNFYVFSWNEQDSQNPLSHTDVNALLLLIYVYVMFDKTGAGIRQALICLQSHDMSKKPNKLSTHYIETLLESEIQSPDMLRLKFELALIVEHEDTKQFMFDYADQIANTDSQCLMPPYKAQCIEFRKLLRAHHTPTTPQTSRNDSLTYSEYIIYSRPEIGESFQYSAHLSELGIDACLCALLHSSRPDKVKVNGKWYVSLHTDAQIHDQFKEILKGRQYTLIGNMRAALNTTTFLMHETDGTILKTTNSYRVQRLTAQLPVYQNCSLKEKPHINVSLEPPPTFSIDPEPLLDQTPAESVTCSTDSICEKIKFHMSLARKNKEQERSKFTDFKRTFSIPDYQAQLLNYRSETQTKVDNLFNYIMRAYENAPFGQVHMHAQTLTSPLDFDSFLQTFSQPAASGQANLCISQEAYQALRKITHQWLWYKTSLMHIKRIDAACQQDDIALIYQLAQQHRNFSFTHPFSYELLLLEYFENVRLRPTQTHIINQLTQYTNGHFDNRVEEAIMGDGKTFIAGPLTLIRAKIAQGQLSILELPENTFSQQYSCITTQLSKVYGIQPMPLIFDRDTINHLKPEEWRLLLNNLTTSIQHQVPVITTPETISCLHLSFIENYRLHPNIHDAGTILQIIRHSHILTDEFDTVFGDNPVIYSIDAHQDFTDIQCHYPMMQTIFSELFRTYLEDNPVSCISEHEYRMQLMPSLLNAVGPFIANMNDELHITPENSQLLSSYLSEPKRTSDIKAIVDNSPSQMKEAREGYLLLYYLIDQIIPLGLSLAPKLSYGQSSTSEVFVAVPYHRGRECTGSRFSNPYQTLILTIFESYRHAITEQKFVLVLSSLREKYRLEPSFKRGDTKKQINILLPEDKFPEFYRTVLDSSFLEKDVKSFLSKLYKNEIATQTKPWPEYYIKIVEYILWRDTIPKLTFCGSRLSHTWAEAPKNAGISGTNFNLSLFPHHQASGSQLIAGRILSTLEDMRVKFSSDKDIQLVEYCKNNKNTRAIIDISACFCPEDMHSYVAEHINDIHTHTGCTTIMYFQGHSFYAQRRGNTHPIHLPSFDKDDINRSIHSPIEERFMIFSAPFCIGTDIALQSNAHALVYIRDENSLTSILQGIMRLRKFGQEQTVHIVFTKNLECSQTPMDFNLWWQNILKRDISDINEQMTRYTLDHIAALFKNSIWQLTLPQSYMNNPMREFFKSKSAGVIDRLLSYPVEKDRETVFLEAITNLSIAYKKCFLFSFNSIKAQALALFQSCCKLIQPTLIVSSTSTSFSDKTECVHQQTQQYEKKHEKAREAPFTAQPNPPLTSLTIYRVLDFSDKYTIEYSENYCQPIHRASLMAKAHRASYVYTEIAQDDKPRPRWVIVSEIDVHAKNHPSQMASATIESMQEGVLNSICGKYTGVPLNTYQKTCFIYTMFLCGNFKWLINKKNDENDKSGFTKILKGLEIPEKLSTFLLTSYPHMQQYIDELLPSERKKRPPPSPQNPTYLSHIYCFITSFLKYCVKRINTVTFYLTEYIFCPILHTIGKLIHAIFRYFDSHWAYLHNDFHRTKHVRRGLIIAWCKVFSIFLLLAIYALFPILPILPLVLAVLVLLISMYFCMLCAGVYGIYCAAVIAEPFFDLSRGILKTFFIIAMNILQTVCFIATLDTLLTMAAKGTSKLFPQVIIMLSLLTLDIVFHESENNPDRPHSLHSYLLTLQDILLIPRLITVAMYIYQEVSSAAKQAYRYSKQKSSSIFDYISQYRRIPHVFLPKNIARLLAGRPNPGIVPTERRRGTGVTAHTPQTS